MGDNIKISNNDSRKKSVNVKNVEPISNIQVIRDGSSSEESSDESSSDSELSEIS